MFCCCDGQPSWLAKHGCVQVLPECKLASVYMDDVSLVFLRNTPGNSSLIRRLQMIAPLRRSLLRLRLRDRRFTTST